MAPNFALLPPAVASAAVAPLIILLCLTAALTSLFLEHCLKPGEIFGRYYLYLSALWIKCRRKPQRRWRALLKPLGLCVYCFGTWVAIGLQLLAWNQLERPAGLPLFYWYGVAPLLLLGGNHLLLKVLSPRLN